jgi:hypothetical protein
MWTADGVGQAFEAVRERQTVNEWGNESTNEDGRPRTADGRGQAFEAVRGEGDRQRMGKRINECGPRTADGRERKRTVKGQWTAVGI